MTGVSVGGTPITGAYFGSTPITGIYKGATKLWPAAASGPAYVRGGAANGNAASLFVPFSDGGTAAAGDLLTASVQYNSSTQTPSMPGWTPEGSVAIPGGARVLAKFSKTAVGGETGVTFALGAAASCSGAVAEWNGAKAGTFTSGTFISGKTGGAFGPTDAPVSSKAIPDMAFGLSGNTTPSISAPWTIQEYSGGQVTAFADEPAPNGPASGTLTNSYGALNAAWLNLWIEPA